MSEELSKEDMEQLEKDVNEAKQALSDSQKEAAVTKAKEEGRAEAEKEFKLQQQLDELRKAKEELDNKLKQQMTESQKQQEDFKKKLDDLTESKQVVAPKNPFENQPPASPNQSVDYMSDEQVTDIEKSSMEAFLEGRSKGGNY